MILINCLAVSFMCIGMFIACTWQGMIFSDVCNWLFHRLPTWITKPLFACPYCMASIWTFVYCISTTDVNLLIFIKIPITCGITAILMHILKTDIQ